jgi:ferric-dicitrate binding protein FerR (iron transport regulator)
MEAFREGTVTYTTHVGKQGERTELTLPDGTAVLLNGSTTLLVPANFAQTHTVILDGEAYFNTPHALKVVTNILTLTTDSAAFRIRCFEHQQGATAYLGTGKVVVNKSYHSSTDNNAEELVHGNMVLANKEIDLMEKETYKPEELALWLKGRLVIERMPLMNAVRMLEDWYGTEIYVDGDVSKIPAVNGVYENKTLAEVLQTLPVNYKMKGDRVNIKVK